MSTPTVEPGAAPPDVPDFSRVSGADRAFVAVDLALPGRRDGKVRVSYALPGGRRLLVTTDRLSAFDRVLAAVRYKGQVLNQLAAWWFAHTADIVANHAVAVPDPNALVAIDARPLPVEVVVRGRLTGSTSTSLLRRYRDGERDLYGQRFPDGLVAHQALPTPVVTPTTKAHAGGHDEPIAPADVPATGLVDAALWDQVMDVAVQLFRRGETVATQAGLVLADTKYEFGLAPDGSLLLIDEVHTPDSSRLWVASTLDERLARGDEPESLDKEPFRLALGALGYRGDGPPPRLDDEVLDNTERRYIAAYELITGEGFVRGAYPVPTRLHASLDEAGIL